MPHATLYWPRSETIPSMIVRLSSLFTKISGHRKSFQIHVNCSVPSTARAGRLIGSATLSSTCPSLAPSTIADSRSALGTVAKKLRISSVQIGMPMAMCTMIIGHRVSSRPR